MASSILNIIFAVGGALSLLYVARTTCSTFSLEDGFKMQTMEALREYGGHLSIHDFVDQKMWSLVFISWSLVFIYQFLTFIRSSSKGTVYSIGHIPWIYNALAMVGMFAHVNWLKLVHARDLSGSLVIVILATYLFGGALMVVLYALYKKTPELEECGLKKDVRIMRMLVINATDFYCTYTLYNMYSILDAYLIKFYTVSPENSCFYLNVSIAVIQVVNLLFDLCWFNWLLRQLAGGYITTIIGSVGIMLYQMVTLPHMPTLTLLNVVLSVLCPLVKMQVQANRAKPKSKEKTS